MIVHGPGSLFTLDFQYRDSKSLGFYWKQGEIAYVYQYHDQRGMEYLRMMTVSLTHPAVTFIDTEY